jgi:hypothetical protein
MVASAEGEAAAVLVMVLLGGVVKRLQVQWVLMVYWLLMMEWE